MVNFDDEQNELPKFDTKDKNCSDVKTCVIRAQVLSRNAEIIKGDLNGAKEGGENTRLQFFPKCTNNGNSYFFVYGTEDQVQGALKNLKFKVIDMSKDFPDAFIVKDQVEKDKLNANGLLEGEEPETKFTNSDHDDCGKDLTKYKHKKETTTIKGKLHYIDLKKDKNGNQDKTKKRDIHEGVMVKAYKDGSLLKNGALTSEGVFVISDIPVNKNSDYPVTIQITDTSNIFEDETVDVVIVSNADATSDKEISAGDIRLVTPDGTVCPKDDNACISDQAVQTGTIEVNLKNSNTGAPVEGVEVSLIKGRSVNGSVVKTAKSDSNGVAKFEDVDYNSYTALVKDSNYEKAASKVALQEPTAKTSVSLNPINSENDLSLSMNTGDSGADMDFKLYIQNPSGHECEVSPLNKYCAYAQHFKDNTPETPGNEIINIKDFAVAKYKSVVEPAPAYSSTCPQADLANSAEYKHTAYWWDWNRFKETMPLTKIPFEFFRNFGGRKAPSTNPGEKEVNSVINMIPTYPFVETIYEALRPKTLLNWGGKILEKPIRVTTYIKPSEDQQYDDPEDDYNEAEQLEQDEPYDSEKTTPIESITNPFGSSSGSGSGSGSAAADDEGKKGKDKD